MRKKTGRKNPAAVALSKLGASKGGKARAASLTPEQRKRSASKAGKVGGKARMKQMTAEQRSEIARLGGLARARKQERKT